MRGLFEKDIRLLLKRRQTLILLGGVAVFMGFTMEGTFIIGYMSVLSTIFTISTISFDEAENCYLFMMTLPIKAVDYVSEKYAFCIFGGFFGWVLSVIIYLIANISKGNPIDLGNDLLMAAVFIPIIIIMCSIMISFQLKFGAEISRIVLIILCGVVAVIGYGVSKIFGEANIPGVVESINNLSVITTFSILALISVIIAVITYAWSLSIMKKKEY